MQYNYFSLFILFEVIISHFWGLPSFGAYGPPKKCLVSGHRSASKSVRWHILFWQAVKDVIHIIHGYWNHTKFPIHKVRWLREAAQIGQIPIWKSYLKQHGRLPINPSILAAIGHRFIATKKENLKCVVWGDVRGDQKPESSLGGNLRWK